MNRIIPRRTTPIEVVKHMKWAKRKNLCTQCVHPWYDGLCECGGGSEYNDKMQRVAKIAIDAEMLRCRWNDSERRKKEEAELAKKKELAASQEFKDKVKVALSGSGSAFRHER